VTDRKGTVRAAANNTLRFMGECILRFWASWLGGRV
jgi:hypothetical protein